VARALVLARHAPGSVDEVLAVLARTFEVEVREGVSWTFDVIVRP
jgi:hypothetical protein